MKYIGPNTTRSYITRSGNRVVLHEFVPRNSNGATVTFPVKGTVIDKDNPRRKHMQIWTLEGRSDVLSLNDDDIIDLPPVLRAETQNCAYCSV